MKRSFVEVSSSSIFDLLVRISRTLMKKRNLNQLDEGSEILKKITGLEIKRLIMVRENKKLAIYAA